METGDGNGGVCYVVLGLSAHNSFAERAMASAIEGSFTVDAFVESYPERPPVNIR